MLASLGHPCKFQRVSLLGSLTARHSSSERQPNFAAMNRGRHLYSVGRPSRWALAHIYSCFSLYFAYYFLFLVTCVGLSWLAVRFLARKNRQPGQKKKLSLHFSVDFVIFDRFCSCHIVSYTFVNWFSSNVYCKLGTIVLLSMVHF